MTMTFKALSTALLGTALLAACSQAAPETRAQTQHAHDHAHAHGQSDYQTVKPGAAVSFSHKADGKFEVGRFTDVVVTLNHSYTDGTIRLQARGTDGVEVLSASASHTVDASVPSSSQWRLSVRPTSGGTQFVSILAEADATPRSSGDMRAYQIRIELGGESTKTTPDMGTMQQTQSGPVMSLQAVETIKTDAPG
jgi:G3E family GTPase